MANLLAKGAESMRSLTRPPICGRVGSSIAAVAALAFVLFALHPTVVAQTGAADRWIGTWSTSEVGRPQTPPAPAGPPLAPFMVNQCPPAPGQAPAAAPAAGQAPAQPS